MSRGGAIARREGAPPAEPGSRALANQRWELFCQHYCGDFRRNAAGAYLAAGYRAASTDIASAAALRLLRNVKVAERIDWLDKEAEAVVRLKARDAIERLAAIATARIGDFLDAAGNVDPEKVRNGPLSAAVADYYAVAMPDGTVSARIKLKDDMRALELLGLTEKPNAPSGAPGVLVIKV